MSKYFWRTKFILEFFSCYFSCNLLFTPHYTCVHTPTSFISMRYTLIAQYHASKAIPRCMNAKIPACFYMQHLDSINSRTGFGKGCKSINNDIMAL